MTSHDRFDELIPIYAIGALEGDELKGVEEHLRTGCPVCRERLKEMENTAHFIPYLLPPASPSPGVKDRILKRIRATKVEDKPYAPTFPERLRPVWIGLGVAVALVLLVFLFISNLSLRDRLRERQMDIANLEDRLNRQNQSLESLKDALSQSRQEIKNLKIEYVRQGEILEFLQNPKVVVINLIGLEPRLEARGRVIWDTESNEAFFYGLNLPKIPSGKTYQLWVIADGAPKSAGVFNVNQKGDSVIKLETLPEPSKIQKFAVTLEPDGGLPQPTGEMYLIGDM